MIYYPIIFHLYHGNKYKILFSFPVLTWQQRKRVEMVGKLTGKHTLRNKTVSKQNQKFISLQTAYLYKDRVMKHAVFFTQS